MFLAVAGKHKCFLYVYTYGVEIYSFFSIDKNYKRYVSKDSKRSQKERQNVVFIEDAMQMHIGHRYHPLYLVIGQALP